MYTTRNFRTKKELKEAVAKYNEAFIRVLGDEKWLKADNHLVNDALIAISKVRPDQTDELRRLRVHYFQPNGDITGVVPPRNGTIYCEGPHYPKPHMWYAECTVKDGCIIKVK